MVAAHRSLRTVIFAVVTIGLLGMSGTGCRLVQTTAELPGRAVASVTPGNANKDAVDPIEAQQLLFRFADAFSARMALGVEKIGQGTNTMTSLDTLRWKIALCTETYAIASGPNPVANTLDMTVFVTVVRAALENYWQPEVFGASAQPILDNCRAAETEIWQLAGKILKPAQQDELRKSIEAWRQQNTNPENVLVARALGLATLVSKASKTGTSQPGSVFSLLMLDPFAGVDPAVREIAETRLFAERALFVSQKMPILLRWQIELLSLNATALPTIQQLVANWTRLTDSMERFASAAERLPGHISGERDALLKALQSQEKDALTLLNAGTEMSDSLNTTLTTLDVLMQRLGAARTNTTPSETNAQPFRIQDYTEAAKQLEDTAQRLTELLTTLDRTMASTNLAALSKTFSPTVEQAKASGESLVILAFWRGVLLVFICLITALAYRFIVLRLSPDPPIEKGTPRSNRA